MRSGRLCGSLGRNVIAEDRDAKMDPFAYHRPESLADACERLGREGARILAGGTDLIPQLREARRRATHIVDVKLLPGCAAIAAGDDGGLVIGAAVPASVVARHPEILARYPALAAAAGMIGSLQVQNRATLGGNICNAAPSADAVPPLLVFDAQVTVSGRSGERRMPLEDVFAGPGRTNLEPGEVLTTIHLPPQAARSASHYLRFTPRREMDIAVVGVAARVACGADGLVSEARIALASVAPTPIRARGAEAALIGRGLDEGAIAEAARAAMAEARPISDTRASAEYRRALVEVLARRALAHCRDRLDEAFAGRAE